MHPPDGAQDESSSVDRILSVAAICFAQRGIRAASMTHICDAAGASPAEIRRHFATKDDIVLALLDRLQGLGLAGLTELTPEAVAAFVCDRMRCWRATGTANAAFMLEAVAEGARRARVAGAGAQALARERQVLIGLVQARLRQAGRTMPDAEVCGRVFTLQCFVEGVVLRAAREPDMDLEVVRQSVRRFVAELIPSFDSAAPVSEGCAS